MSKRILVKADGGGGLQAFYNVGQGGGPSFRQLARRAFKDPTAGKVERIGAGLGLAGKVGAGLATGLQTAYGLQGGNISSALQIPQTYMSLDPTAGQNAVVTPQEMQQQMRDQATKKLLEAQVGYATATGQNIGDVWQAGGQALQSTTPTNRGALRPNPTIAPPPQTAAQPQPQQISGPVAVSQPSHTPQGPYSNQAILQQMTTQQPAAQQTATSPPQQTLNIDAQALDATSVPTDPNVSLNQNVTTTEQIQQPATTQTSLSQYQPSATTQTNLYDDFNLNQDNYTPQPRNPFALLVSTDPMRTITATTPFNTQQMQQMQAIHDMMQRGGAGAQGTIDTQLQQFNQGLREGMPSVTRENIGQYLNKSFVDYAYELHGDILRKATPHEAGLLVMNMYLEMLR